MLGTGVLVFVFYLFQPPPMLFNRAYDPADRRRPAGRASTRRSRAEFERPWPRRRSAAEQNNREAFLASDARMRDIRGQGDAIVKQTTGDSAVQRRELRLSDLHHHAPCRSGSSA